MTEIIINHRTSNGLSAVTKHITVFYFAFSSSGTVVVLTNNFLHLLLFGEEVSPA